MHFERADLDDRFVRNRAARRVWDGLVRGLPDCWVVVARDERDLAEWMECEMAAVDEAPLRICRAILDDDVLVLSPTDEDEPQWGSR